MLSGVAIFAYKLVLTCLCNVVYLRPQGKKDPVWSKKRHSIYYKQAEEVCFVIGIRWSSWAAYEMKWWFCDILSTRRSAFLKGDTDFEQWAWHLPNCNSGIYTLYSYILDSPQMLCFVMRLFVPLLFAKYLCNKNYTSIYRLIYHGHALIITYNQYTYF